MPWKEYCAEYWQMKLQESLDRYTGRSDITEIILKIALKLVQSINRSYIMFKFGFDESESRLQTQCKSNDDLYNRWIFFFFFSHTVFKRLPRQGR